MPAKSPPKRSRKNSTELVSPQSSVTHGEIWQMSGLGDRLRVTRIKSGFENQGEFAQHADVSRQYVSNIETGKVSRPEAMPMLKISKALNVSLVWLLTGEELEPGPKLDITPIEANTIKRLREASPDQQKIIDLVLKQAPQR